MDHSPKKLACIPATGTETHLVVDFYLSKNPGLHVMTACGRLVKPDLLMDMFHRQITCERCRSVSHSHGHKIGYTQNSQETT